MADATRIDIPPGQVSTETAKCTDPTQNMLEQVNGTEPPEHIHFTEAQIIEHVQIETGTVASSIFSEQLQPVSDIVAKGSLPLVSGQQNEPLEPIAATATCPINEHSESSPGNLTNDSASKELELRREDVSMNSQTGKKSCPEEVASEVKHECGAENLCTELAGTKYDVDSNLLQTETRKTVIMVSDFVSTEKLELISENASLNSGENLVVPSKDVIRHCQIEKSSCPQQNALGRNKDLGCGRVLGEAPKQVDHLCSGLVQNVLVETSVAACNGIVSEHLEPPLGDVSESHIDKQVEQPFEDVPKSSTLEQFENSSKSLVNTPSQSGRRDKRMSKSRKKKYMLRSLVYSDRVLRSRTQGKPKALESSSSLKNVGNRVVEKKMKEKKMKKGTRIIDDEFSRIRKRLRYFLNRIHYEQNLIDAYSSEGWKGTSLEKVKPEKELQRAKSEILRRKLKIRDLFQQLDSLCAEGRFPKSLFDSEGQIDSEDIFCAKCGSKDMSANNDIILCDGACDRGFHQFCLEPPLLSEEIPPDDEGWLCPGCDCKVDCFDFLNDSQGTNFSVTNSWEKVFPEAAAAARVGKDQDHNLEFPSHDSDDDDYDPDGPEIDEKVKGNESSSEESEYASACEELEGEAPPKDEQKFGLSSDDSEDNDYDPDAADVNEIAKQESSSSDFTSDSEDLDFARDDGQVSDNDDVHMSSSLDPKRPLGNAQTFKRGRNESSIKDELLDILDSGAGQDGALPISGKRHVERLDYKRLHDEAYGNVPSDSSDDEDWTDNPAPRKRKRATGQVSSVSPNGNASTVDNETTMEVANNDLEDDEYVPRRRTRQNSMVTDENNSPNKSLDGSSKSGSAGKRRKSSTHRRLGEVVTQRLYKSFKENQYPDRATKQSLADELGLTSHQVSKWFENARWSYRHSSRKLLGVSEGVSKETTLLPQTNKKPVESEQNTKNTNLTCNRIPNEDLPSTGNDVPESCTGDVGNGKPEMLAGESSGQTSTTPGSRKRRGRPPKVERSETLPAVDTNETGSRKRGRRQKSAS